MSGISTHVLDVARGKPAAGVAVKLERLDGGGWIEVSTCGAVAAERVQDAPGSWVTVSAGATDEDGRWRDLPPVAEAGTYRLTLATGDYLLRHGRTSIYPEISITFCCSGEAHYHLPVLLSDNSYTTYRGS